MIVKKLDELRLLKLLDKFHNDYRSLSDDDYILIEEYINLLEETLSKIYIEFNKLNKNYNHLKSILEDIKERVY